MHATFAGLFTTGMGIGGIAGLYYQADSVLNAGSQTLMGAVGAAAAFYLVRDSLRAGKRAPVYFLAGMLTIGTAIGFSEMSRKDMFTLKDGFANKATYIAAAQDRKIRLQNATVTPLVGDCRDARIENNALVRPQGCELRP